jgi:hypothetical protein
MMSDMFFILAQATVVASAAQGTITSAPVDSFYAFYAANLRGSLFSGFLTLGSFLVAVNTFIVVNMKKELYDTAAYREQVKSRRQLSAANGKRCRVTFFGPLRRLSGCLFWAIVFALLTAVSQLTIGLIPSRWTAVACIGLAALTILILLALLLIVRRNLSCWFGFMEAEAEKQVGNSTTSHLPSDPTP